MIIQRDSYIEVNAYADQTANMKVKNIAADIGGSTLVGIEFEDDLTKGLTQSCDRDDFLCLDVSDPAQEAILAQLILLR